MERAVDLIVNYADLYYRRFYTFNEAIEFIRQKVGLNYHVK